MLYGWPELINGAPRRDAHTTRPSCRGGHG